MADHTLRLTGSHVEHLIDAHPFGTISALQAIELVLPPTGFFGAETRWKSELLKVCNKVSRGSVGFESHRLEEDHERPGFQLQTDDRNGPAPFPSLASILEDISDDDYTWTLRRLAKQIEKDLVANTINQELGSIFWVGVGQMIDVLHEIGQLRPIASPYRRY